MVCADMIVSTSASLTSEGLAAEEGGDAAFLQATTVSPEYYQAVYGRNGESLNMDKGGYGCTENGFRFGCLYDGVSSGGPTSILAAQSYTNTTLNALSDELLRPTKRTDRRVSLIASLKSWRSLPSAGTQALETLRAFGEQMFDYASVLGPQREQGNFGNFAKTSIPTPDPKGEGGSATGVFAYVTKDVVGTREQKKQPCLRLKGVALGDAVALVIKFGDADTLTESGVGHVHAIQLNATRHNRDSFFVTGATSKQTGSHRSQSLSLSLSQSQRAAAGASGSGMSERADPGGLLSIGAGRSGEVSAFDEVVGSRDLVLLVTDGLMDNIQGERERDKERERDEHGHGHEHAHDLLPPFACVIPLILAHAHWESWCDEKDDGGDHGSGDCAVYGSSSQSSSQSCINSERGLSHGHDGRGLGPGLAWVHDRLPSYADISAYLSSLAEKEEGMCTGEAAVAGAGAGAGAGGASEAAGPAGIAEAAGGTGGEERGKHWRVNLDHLARLTCAQACRRLVGYVRWVTARRRAVEAKYFECAWRERDMAERLRCWDAHANAHGDARGAHGAAATDEEERRPAKKEGGMEVGGGGGGGGGDGGDESGGSADERRALEGALAALREELRAMQVQKRERKKAGVVSSKTDDCMVVAFRPVAMEAGARAGAAGAEERSKAVDAEECGKNCVGGGGKRRFLRKKCAHMTGRHGYFGNN